MNFFVNEGNVVTKLSSITPWQFSFTSFLKKDRVHFNIKWECIETFQLKYIMSHIRIHIKITSNLTTYVTNNECIIKIAIWNFANELFCLTSLMHVNLIIHAKPKKLRFISFPSKNVWNNCNYLFVSALRLIYNFLQTWII